MVDRETTIPPFSSKVSRSILMRLHSSLLSADKGSLKPYRVTPLFRGSRPLVKYTDGHKERLKLYPEAEYYFEYTGIGKRAGVEALMKERRVELFGSRFTITGIEFKKVAFSSIKVPNAEYYKMTFLTPVLLSLPYSREKYGHVRHMLFPHTFLMFHSLIRHWNLYAPRRLIYPDQNALARYAYYNLPEADFQIVPKTAIYDEKRRPRGFTGWIILRRLKGKGVKDARILNLLDYANYIGIGRSKSIGFGLVRVMPIKPIKGFR